MLVLSDCIKVEICANSHDELECWLKRFGEALQGITAISGKGYWNGECEDIIEITHFLNPDQNLTDFIVNTLIPLLSTYKVEANQEAVFFTVNGVAYLVDDLDDFRLFGEEGVLPPSLTSTPGTALNWGAETFWGRRRSKHVRRRRQRGAERIHFWGGAGAERGRRREEVNRGAKSGTSLY